MSSPAPPDLTTTLLRLDSIEGAEVDRIMPIVYDELRRLARSHLLRERPDHTLSATALANEAYLKLVDQTRATWKSRAHFMAVASRAIRRILIDYARRRGREKRGGGQAPVSLRTSIALSNGKPESVDLIALNDALERLAAVEPEKARVVEMRFFGEMTEPEIAELLGVTERTVRRYWQYARAWLFRELYSDTS